MFRYFTQLTILALGVSTSASIAQARSTVVCVGLTQIDPKHYGGDSGILHGCDNDAKDMQAIGAKYLHSSGTPLLNEHATRDAVLNAIKAAQDPVSGLGDGDIFMISFSGHGGQVPDEKADATNGMDQTWCLYDGQLLDKELYAQFSHFHEGVRVLVFSDSCHSEGVTRSLILQYQLANPAAKDRSSASISLSIANVRFQKLVELEKSRHIKGLSPSVLVKAYLENKSTYDKIISDIERPKSPINPWVLSISACKDDETAGDAGDGRNSVFTAALAKVWNDGSYRSDGDYTTFADDIGSVAVLVRSDQHATRRMIDTNYMAYWWQYPFTAVPP